jgi:hypothetical protein
VGLAVVLATVAVASLTPATARAGTVDPQDTVESIFDELNAGDVDGVLALVTDDFILTDINGGSFAAVGKPAFRLVNEDVVARNAQITLTDLDVDGNAVTGVSEWSDDGTDDLGIDRYLQPFTIVVNDAGLATRGDFTYDTTDAETQEFLDSLEDGDAGDDGDDEEPPGLVTVELAAQPGGNQPGDAFIFPADDGVTGVGLFILPGPAGVQQPAHFHTGTCAAPGPIVEPLANVLDSGSFTYLSAGISELVDTGLIINVHKSVAESSVYVACGEVLSAAAPTPTTAPVTPAATATRPAGIVAPSTGTGGASGGDATAPLWLYAVLAAGVLVSIAGAVRLRQ